MSSWTAVSGNRSVLFTDFYFEVEIARLLLVLTDVDAWSEPERPRLLSSRQSLEVIYGFADQSRAFVELTQLPLNRVYVQVRHEFATDDSAATYQRFWSRTGEMVETRLSTQTLAMASAPGKLNMFFKVGPLKKDGYHDVVSVYQALNLRERVLVSASHNWQIGVSGSLPTEHLQAVPTDESNLVVKAAKLISELAGLPSASQVAFGIDKQVPVAGGMGGGSADAAAAAVAVNELWATGFTTQELVEITKPLGADVPFAVLGGTALGLGVGEKLTPIDNIAPLHWVMIASPGGLSTPAVFKRLDELRADRKQRVVSEEYLTEPTELLEALRVGNPFEIAELLHNDLQEAAVDLMPSLGDTIVHGMRCGALKAMVSGSGPTVALLCGSEDAAVEVAVQMRALGYSAIATSGPAEGAKVDK